MSAVMIPSAEHVLEVGIRKATEAIRAGWPVEDVTRILVVAGYAADLMQTDSRWLET